jgi:hypothetical protein
MPRPGKESRVPRKVLRIIILFTLFELLFFLPVQAAKTGRLDKPNSIVTPGPRVTFTYQWSSGINQPSLHFT